MCYRSVQTRFRRPLRRLEIGLVLATASVALADWPNFRGPNHDGISTETNLKTEWSGSIPVVWERDIGSAFSSFAAVGDRLYTCGEKDKRQALYALNADTGEVIWEKPFEEAYRDSHGDGTRATPTVDGGRVYILGGHGRLLCVDAKDGRELWSTQFHHAPQWGYSGSVLIEGDLAVASAGQSDGSLIALNKKTGNIVWKSGSDPAGYATPFPFTIDGRRFLVGFLGDSAMIVDAGTGREVWRTPWQTDWNVNAASPIFHDGDLFLSSGYKTGCGLFRIKPDGDGLSGAPVWRSKVLMNKFQSPILFEGNLYSTDQKAFKCVDFATGEERWEIRRVKHGTIVLADEHLFLLTEDGELRIGKASPKEFTPTATVQVLSGRCWTVPVIHRGRLYARNMERVVCLNVRE